MYYKSTHLLYQVDHFPLEGTYSYADHKLYIPIVYYGKVFHNHFIFIPGENAGILVVYRQQHSNGIPCLRATMKRVSSDESLMESS